ncbi:MAG: CCA tRNA nucleotidyltransferase [Bacteroidales bacterium OttesenSCG-928-I14]|nr:CCA tRNA nucleotidyltransferase [Bacteroidales bacterium OttesenSCG-928-I14]
MAYSSNHVFKILTTASDKLNIEAYVVGGFVRDILLNRSSKDIDIVCVGSGIALAKEVSKQLTNSDFAIFKNYGTAQIKYLDIKIEFVGARKESYNWNSRNPEIKNGTFEEDIKRRDFTINTLAVCINKSNFGKLINLFDGLTDLEKCIIRTPLNPSITFSDDPLRMLRAIRFASQLGFFIETKTFEAIKNNCNRITIISKERVVSELNKIILSPRPSIGFNLLEKTGLLHLIFPELIALKGKEIKEDISHKDIFKHTLIVIDNLSKTSNKLWLRWAALFHDIGKSITKRFNYKSGWTFYGHEYKGAEMLKKIFVRTHMPLNDKFQYTKKMISLHMRPIVLSNNEVTDSAIRRLLFDAGNDIDDLMLLCEADITSKNLEKVKQFSYNFKLVRNKLESIEKNDKIKKFQPPINGLEIMKMFSLPACKQIGELKSAVKEAILDGVISNDYEAARNYLISLAKQKEFFE